MKVCGIVSEFNPFHNGHKYLISEVKKMGFDAVVCVMSGNFVQRGEYAVADKKLRASIATENGADLVLSLPFPWSSATAEHFASAAISIFNALGCIDAVAFGSESGNPECLTECAKALSEVCSEEVIAYQKHHPDCSFARARQEILKLKMGSKYSDVLESPNDILGIEYIKAIIKQGSNIIPIPIKRIGALHDGEYTVDNIASSSKIRELYLCGRKDMALAYLPCEESFFDTFIRIDDEKFFSVLCGAILSKTPNELTQIAEIGGGLEFALYREMLVANNLKELCSALGAKHLTAAKIRRSLLFASIGVKKSDFSRFPAFTEVLSFTGNGQTLLSAIRKSAGICVLSKIGNIKQASEIAREQFKLQRKAEIIFDKIKL